MPVTVNWDNEEKTIIRYDIIEPWTWDEMWVALEKDDELIDSIDHIVHLLFNGEAIKVFPGNPIGHLRMFASKTRQPLGLIVIVGPNVWIHTIVSLFSKLLPRRAKGMEGILSARTVEEGRALIEAHRKKADTTP